jgi:hypothetical protein
MEEQSTEPDQGTMPTAAIPEIQWGADAPRGGKAVLNRILKEKATVPLFFAQTLVQSMRDAGYNHTTSALCEHVDNAVQAGATEVRVYFRQEGRKANKRIDVAVYDNGRGMAPAVLKVAMAFGGSMHYGSRQGIARFGMGMKTAALSMSSVLEVYSWQEPEAIYTMTLDVEAIGRERANLVELPDATLLTELSDEVADFFRKPQSYPTDRSEQQLVAAEGESVADNLGSSGTIVYMPDCDRLHYAKTSTLVDHAVKEMARVYRRAIAGGLRLYINNRLVEAFDPTYWMSNARHARFVDSSAKQSRLILSKPVPVPVSEGSSQTAPALIKIYKLPIEEWSLLPRKTQRNDLRIFDGMTVSILRNDREVFAGSMPNITTRHSVTNWYRVQIDFEGILDEAFGVAANKQGVRPKGYVVDAINEAIGDDISTLNEEIKRFGAQQKTARTPAKPSPSETKANDADPFQQNEMPVGSPDEEAHLDANLRGLALTLKRDGENDEEAFERVKHSHYIIDFRHDEYWPFFDVKHQFGRIILTINTAHPFFTELYDPVNKIGRLPATAEDEDSVVPNETQHGPIVALDLLLLSLARTQSRLASTSEETNKLLNTMRREWSETYRVQMNA